MKKKFGKRLLYASSLSLLLGAGVYSYGCADGWWSYSSVSSFTPEAFVDNSYKPLFFAPYEKFYDGAYMYNAGMYNEDIVKEWTQYLGNAVPADVVKECLVSNEFEIDTMYTIYSELRKGKKRSSIYDLDLKNKKVENFINFLNFAKTVEQYSAQEFEYWNYEQQVKEQLPTDYANKVQSFYEKMDKKDTFFANRMWFQVMKAKFYSADKSSVIAYFESTASSQLQNTLYYRAMSYVAGAYYEQANFAKSNLLYATVFDREPSMRQVALYNFKPLDKAAITKIVENTEDRDVKAAIWSIMGYYDDLGESMKRAYEVNPKSPHIDYILTRWVNMQEQEVNVFAESSFKSRDEYFKAIKKKIDQNTLKWIKSVADKPQEVANPVLWKLAAGYMDIFQGEYKSATKQIEEASNYSKKGDKLLAEQIRLFALINTVSQVKKLDKSTEEKLLPELKWVYTELVKNDYSDPFRYEYAAGWIRQFLSATYKEQGNAIMAEILNSQGVAFYKDKKQSSAMESFLLKTNHSEIEKLFTSLYQYNLSDIYESRAIHLFYEDKIDEAIVEMKKAELIKKKNTYDDEYTVLMYNTATLLGNPFNGKIKDCNDCDHAAKQTTVYTKLSFLEKLRDMKANIANGTDVFSNALLVGNAYYNATYFGNARVLYYNSIWDEYGSNSIGMENKSSILNMNNARKYYTIAKQHATTKEEKAKLAYFDAKLERNEFYVQTYHNKDYYMGAWGDDVMFKKWNGFSELAAKYSDTKYYQEVIKECGYFRKYLGLNY